MGQDVHHEQKVTLGKQISTALSQNIKSSR